MSAPAVTNPAGDHGVARVIAVTGASRGIGAAIAIELATRGCVVGCLSRNGKGIEASHSADARFINIACDVTDEAAVVRALAELVTRAGRIDGLVNNAGIHLAGRSHDAPMSHFDEVMAVNARAVFVGCRAVYPHLIDAGGVIINIGSFFDKLGVRENVAYCASKAAVGAITRCLAVEWARYNIRVLDVAPGYIDTELNADAMAGPLRSYLQKRIPGKQLGTAQDVAKLVAMLATEALPFMTGETIYLDGGQGMAH